MAWFKNNRSIKVFYDRTYGCWVWHCRDHDAPCGCCNPQGFVQTWREAFDLADAHRFSEHQAPTLRRVVVTENKMPFPGTFLLPNSLSAPSKDFVPITYDMYGESALAGKATGFERNELTGDISFAIELRHEVVSTDPENGRTSVRTEYRPVDEHGILDMCDFGVFASEVLSYTKGDIKFIEMATIQGITLLPRAAIPLEATLQLPDGSHE